MYKGKSGGKGQSQGGADFEKKPGKGSIGNEIKGAQSKLKELKEETLRKKITEETEDALESEKGLRNIFTSLVGSSMMASLLMKITNLFTGEFDPDEVRRRFDETAEEIAKKKINIEDYIVSHRALGYGRNKQNSKEALMSALKGGEQQVEIDVRELDGKLYLSHDPIDKKVDKKKLLSFEDALETFSTYGKRDKKGDLPVLFIDVKERGLMKKIDSAIDNVDGRKLGEPIRDRHFVNTFDVGIMREASKRPRPLIFYYLPTKKITGLSTMLSVVGWKGAKRLLGAVDSAAGTSYAKSLSKTGLNHNGKSIGKDPKGGEKSFNIFDELPSDDILEMIRKSGGYICIPPQLATKELVEKAHSKGVKVAVWGANDERIKKMIFDLNVDMVISDTPDIVKNEPVQMAA
jgi:glycerophosphoryl diester phosphodiesterase